MNHKVIIIKGVSMALGVSALLLGIALFQAFLDPKPLNYLSAYSRFFIALSLLTGGFYAGVNVGQKGWLVGASVGFMYSLIGCIASILLIPRLLSFRELVNALVPGTILAGMAGVCGVNIARAKRRQAKTRKMGIKKKLNN